MSERVGTWWLEVPGMPLALKQEDTRRKGGMRVETKSKREEYKRERYRVKGRPG